MHPALPPGEKNASAVPDSEEGHGGCFGDIPANRRLPFAPLLRGEKKGGRRSLF